MEYQTYFNTMQLHANLTINDFKTILSNGPIAISYDNDMAHGMNCIIRDFEAKHPQIKDAEYNMIEAFKTYMDDTDFMGKGYYLPNKNSMEHITFSKLMAGLFWLYKKNQPGFTTEYNYAILCVYMYNYAPFTTCYNKAFIDGLNNPNDDVVDMIEELRDRHKKTKKCKYSYMIDIVLRRSTTAFMLVCKEIKPPNVLPDVSHMSYTHEADVTTLSKTIDTLNIVNPTEQEKKDILLEKAYLYISKTPYYMDDIYAPIVKNWDVYLKTREINMDKLSKIIGTSNLNVHNEIGKLIHWAILKRFATKM